MLTELRIRDFAIIDDLQLAFEPGFSVLTGETGAGKSIIVDAVDLVLGGRSDSARRRERGASARVGIPGVSLASSRGLAPVALPLAA